MNAETLEVNRQFDLLQGMSYITKSNINGVGITGWREIEFGIGDRAYLIRQETYPANHTGNSLMSTFYSRDSQWHRLDGPAIEQNHGSPNENEKCNFGWAIDGQIYTEIEFNFWMGNK